MATPPMDTTTDMNIEGKLTLLPLLLALGLVCAGCGSSSDASSATADDSHSSGSESHASAEAAPDIVDTAVAAGSFSTLVAAVQAAGLEDTLRGDGPFTVFAPTDAAFAALPAGTVEELLLPENRDRLVAILTYHVVAGDVRAAQVVGMSEATTVQGSSIAISAEGGAVMLNGSATVTQTDIECGNGVIHVIDTVILPPG